MLQRGAALRARIRSIAQPSRTRPLAGLLATLCITCMTFLGVTRAEKPASATDNDTMLIAIEVETVRFQQDTTWDFGGRFKELDPEDQGIQSSRQIEFLGEKDVSATKEQLRKLAGVEMGAYPRMVTQDGKEVVIRSVVNQTVPGGKDSNGKELIADLPIGFVGKFTPKAMQDGKVALNIDITDSHIIATETIQGREYPVAASRVYSGPVELQPGITVAQYSWQSHGWKDGKPQSYRPTVTFITTHVIDSKKGGLPADASNDFAIGHSAFLPGDSVHITKVQRGGGFMTVTADYELASADKANISLYITSTKDSGGTKTDPNQRKTIAKGKGRVVLHHPDVREGMPHVSFYPSGGGSSFGGIYFGTQAEADASQKMSASRAAPAASKTSGASSSSFTLGNSAFLPGDSIQIVSVERSADQLSVTADYTLASQEKADLHLCITSDQKAPPFDRRQATVVTKGKGRVTLHHPSPPPGQPHLTYYAPATHKPFGGIYFGTPEEATQSRKFNLSHMTDAARPSVIEAKLQSIILPRVQFNGASIEEAVEFLRVKSREFDTLDKTGVQFILRTGGTKPGRISLDLKDVPLIEVLRYCTELAGLTYKIEPYAVTIGAANAKATAKLEITAKADIKTTVATRANKIILPSVEFRDATLVEAIEFIRAKSREHDPDKKGVNILLKGDGGTVKITLYLKDVPVPEALRYCAELANYKLSADENSFVLTPTPSKTGAATSQSMPSDNAMLGANTVAQEKAAELRRAKPQMYDFTKAPLGDVLRFLATDAGINFFALPDDNPINQKLVTFSIRASPFAALESLCRANGAVLVFDQDRWFIRAADDPTQIGKVHVLPPTQASVETIADDPGQIGKGYVLPQTQASVETILKDISSILGGDETKPVADKPQPSVQFKKEQNSVYVKATRLQHTWVSAYLRGLSSSAQSATAK
ncbi:MAG: hypothetical protein Q8M07_23100 [Prosthecobacter sp.]|nr:hypothetical protein [Prosthecobacter sp.]